MVDSLRNGLSVLLLAWAALASGCGDAAQWELPVPPVVSLDNQTGSSTVQPVQGTEQTSFGAGAASIRDEISVATWNIQVFGQSKMSKPDVMEIIVDVVRRFDVIAIQELRSKDQSIIEEFLKLVNRDGYEYGIVVGPRLGRTSSKEQYLYLYDTNRIELLDNSVYTVDDPHDLLHREPLVASFRVIGANSGNPWTFTLVNIHTDPDEVKTEVNVLDDVLRIVRQTDAEDDIILLGDLNADVKKLGDLADIPNMMWTVSGQPTNTRGTKSYDNILFSGTSTREFTGHSGIVDLETEYALSRDKALDVSDHLPVWATFAPVEQQAVLASEPVATPALQ